MEIKPLKSKTPQYPSLEEFISHSNLLGKSIPQKWLNNKIVACALTAFLLSGNSHAGDKMSNNENIEYAVDDSQAKKYQDSVNIKKVINAEKRLAPIFVNGSGSAAIGCFVMNAPVYISENEAIDIIFEELSRENIKVLKETDKTFEMTAYPYDYNCKDSSGNMNKRQISLKVDCYIEDFDFSIFYISADDSHNFEFKCYGEPEISVGSIETRKAAERVYDRIRQSKKINAVIFYDPLYSMEFYRKRYLFMDYDKVEEQAKKMSMKMLCRQVADFIEWMRFDGLIK